MSSLVRAVVVLAVSIGVGACSRRQPAPAVQDAMKPAPAHGAPAPSAFPSGASVTGPVLETMNAASYTYVRVRGENGEIWAAGPQAPITVGDRVRVPLENPMQNFHSTSLNRDFPLIYFASQISTADGTAAAAAPAAADNPHGASRAEAATVTTPMAAPAGGLTIANLWANRTALAGKPVTVHGVVVKYNPDILGLNWIHLQDGTGKAADGSNDVTVTFTDDVRIAVGDTVVASGTAAIDKNIGAGYSYPVLVEHARVSAVGKTAGS
jgi:hypothetical protein